MHDCALSVNLFDSVDVFDSALRTDVFDSVLIIHQLDSALRVHLFDNVLIGQSTSVWNCTECSSV